MKYSNKRQRYEASNVSFNPETFKAYSYGWWQFVAKIDGKIYFNTHFYSPSTCKHQSKVRRLLDELGIKIDYKIDCPEGFQAEHWYKISISNYKYDIDILKAAINKKGSRKATNARREAEIKELEAIVNFLELKFKYKSPLHQLLGIEKNEVNEIPF